jgi:peptidoglycan/xylan/chitin deacetylase (PgdA/CDA1 family)
MVVNGTLSILNILKKYSISATFFIPSLVAERFPLLLEEIMEQKHEIACHGLRHDPQETTLNFNKQLQIIKKATEIIQSATGLRPRGFRAPLFRINENSWKALIKNDYIYDSSIVCSPFYGTHIFFPPRKPFFIPATDMHNKFGLLEIPVSINPILPFPLGGAWLRIFGSRWSKIGIKLNFLFETPVVFYIHPKDVIPRTFGRTWYSYRNTSSCTKMLEDLIKYAKQRGAKFLKCEELAEDIFKQISEKSLTA